MSGTRRFPRADALAVAKELCAILKPLCLPDRLKVCGSLRRGKSDVGDIELVFIQRVEMRPDPDDLLHPLVPMELVWLQLYELVDKGVLTRRPKSDGTYTWGDQIRLAVHIASGIPVDFFVADESNWWNLVVCRTGSANSNVQLCNAAIKRGWKWMSYGIGFSDRATGQTVRRVSSERDVFEAVGLPYVEPRERNF